MLDSHEAAAVLISVHNLCHALPFFLTCVPNGLMSQISEEDQGTAVLFHVATGVPHPTIYAWHAGPSMMPGGSEEAYQYIEKIVTKVAAQVDDGPCVTYIGSGGSGNFVKMVHNGIEYGDMQLIAEAYDMLKTVGGMSNKEIAEVFAEWNKGELESFLAEITSIIFTVKDDQGKDGELLDYILDKTGSKGTGKWTVQQAAEMLTPAPTIAAALDGRCDSNCRLDVTLC